MSSLKNIPVFDLSDYARDKQKFAEDFGRAFREYGFLRLKNHGIPERVLVMAEAAVTRFFTLDDKTKENYSFPEQQFQIGYVKNGEKADGQTETDKKEYYMLCRDTRRDTEARHLAETPDINEVPEFRADSYELYYEFQELIQRVLQPLALHMGLPEDWFKKRNTRSENIMRMIHYPAGGNAANHIDLSMLTLLRAEKPGLYVTTRNGDEIEVVAEKGELILNGGMTLAALTNNYFKPSYHRVDVKTATPRQTIVFFATLNPEVMIDIVPKFRRYQGGLREESWFKVLSRFPIPCHDFIRERIKTNFNDLKDPPANDVVPVKSTRQSRRP